MAQQQLSTNTFGCAKWIVSATASDGTHTTIASALTSASSGDTIFIRPGTYTENLTLKAGVNLTAFGSDSSQNGTGKVIISGTCTLTTAGSVTISGIQLQTNSAALLAVTGSAASIVNLDNCYLNITNNDGITFSSSSASAAINMKDSIGNLGTTGIKIFAHTSAGSLLFNNCYITNTGASTTASTITAGTLTFFYTTIFSPVTSSGTATVGMSYSGIATNAQNVTCITCGGSGAHNLNQSSYSSGTASGISISNTTGLNQTYVNSSNTNSITGAGTVNYTNLVFPISSSAKINTTTQVGGVAAGGLTQAPSAGFIGEVLSSTATGVSLTTATAKTITSVSITPGIWDITILGDFNNTGVTTAHQYSISTTDNTIEGTIGIQAVQFGFGVAPTSIRVPLIVPCFRVVLTATTTYYAVGLSNFSTGTCTAGGRISAVRVG